MKKLILFSFLTALLLNTNAQWYNRKYGVSNINDLTQQQLMLELNKANSMFKTGKILTVIGGVSIGVGGLVATAGLMGIFSGVVNWSSESIDRSDKIMITGLSIGLIGAVIFWTGLPIMITGKSRKNSINIALVKYKPVTFLGTRPILLPGIGIKINF